MEEVLLTVNKVSEWVNETPATITAWSKNGTDMFPYYTKQSDGTLRWKQGHIQEWLESMEDLKDVGFIQPPETCEEALHPPQFNRELDDDEGEVVEA